MFTFGIVWPTNGGDMHAPSVVCACALRERRRGRDQPLEISSRKPSAFWMSPSSTSSMKKTSGEFAGIFPFFSSPYAYCGGTRTQTRWPMVMPGTMPSHPSANGNCQSGQDADEMEMWENDEAQHHSEDHRNGAEEHLDQASPAWAGTLSDLGIPSCVKNFCGPE